MLKKQKGLLAGKVVFLLLIPGFIGLITISPERNWKELRVVSLNKISGIIEKQERKNFTKETVNLKLSVPFIPNEGQFERGVKFKASLPSGSLFLTEESLVYSFVKRKEKEREEPERENIKDEGKAKIFAFRERFVDKEGKTLKQKPEGREESITKVSFFKGNDPKKWKSGLRTYNEISLGEVYRGVEIRLRVRGKNVEKVFYVEPGTDPEEIRIEVEGAKRIEINSEGELVIESGYGEIVMKRPIAYQIVDGQREEVTVSYNKEKENIYGFLTGKYSKKHPLIIDPQINLTASTFLGGGASENSRQITFDSLGNVYVIGDTESSNFPVTVGAYDTEFNGYRDVFISKLNSSLTSLLSSTYLGGYDQEFGNSIKLDS